RLVLKADVSDVLTVEGHETARVAMYARHFMKHFGIRSGAYLKLEESIPAHVGLGSGTQLGLAVGSALARLSGLDLSAADIAPAVGSGIRSGIGISAFRHGGFVLDGGRALRSAADMPSGKDRLVRSMDDGSVPPLLFRRSVPKDWFFVVAIPQISRGLHGKKEKSAFTRLPAAPEEAVARICWTVLMKMLPALVENDIVRFGEALTGVQRMVGDCFAAVQGGRYAAPRLEEIVVRLLENGAAGAGQSSWGPAVYGVVQGKERAARLAEALQEYLNDSGGGRSFHVRPDNHGARLIET
ncbi:MAG TPA: beta-ribofuranosylaminobenzene 5'-phosphate synthase family protein, partial [Acidobacteriota bacterium]|nr:beta-ribofuranosylaminobenzene 5'-phosphate synthase family protein [Acidobacteriota bacterium]